MADTSSPQGAQITFTMKAFPSFHVSLDAGPLLKVSQTLQKALSDSKETVSSQSVALPFSKEGHGFTESAAVKAFALLPKCYTTSGLFELTEDFEDVSPEALFAFWHIIKYLEIDGAMIAFTSFIRAKTNGKRKPPTFNQAVLIEKIGFGHLLRTIPDKSSIYNSGLTSYDTHYNFFCSWEGLRISENYCPGVCILILRHHIEKHPNKGVPF